MSYTKDRDRFTRGPGAIAARDNSRRFKRRVAMRRLSEARDRVLAKYTYGPQGGLGGGFGAIKEIEQPTDPRPSQGSGSSGPGPSAPRPRPSYDPGGGSTPPTGTPKPRPLIRGGAPYNPRGTTGTNTGAYPRPPVDVIVDPAPPLPPLPLPPPYAPPVVTGGGGAGSGIDPLPPPFVPPAMDPPAVPPDLPSSSSGPDLKKLAMVGGAAVAIWYLFLRDKPA